MHARLAPSSAPQWGYCSGSVPANAAVPNFDTQASREGTAAHWVGAECLKSFRSSSDNGGLLCNSWIGATDPAGVVIDEKMAEGAQIWVSDVLNVCNQYGALQSLLIEHRVHMPQIHDECWGTLDTAAWIPEANTLYLWDYKHGHRECSAKGNLQLIAYVAGLLAKLSGQPDIDRIVMRVVQPFCYKSDGPIDEWQTTPEELVPYFEQLRYMANEALTDPKMSAGKHCRDCAAIGRCATARRTAYSVIAYASEPYDIDTMGGADLATERQLLAVGSTILKARQEAIEDELQHRINGGATDTGLTMQATFGRLAWSVPPAQAVALAGQFGVDISKPDVLTPTQAKNKVPKEMRSAFEQVLQTVTIRNSTGMTLINAEDAISAQAFKRK